MPVRSFHCVKNLKQKPGWAPLGLLLILWLAASGCETFNRPPDNSLASVTITNRPLADVQLAVIKVFTAHGYTGTATPGSDLSFSRKGSRMDELLYGNYVFQQTVTVNAQVTTQMQPDSSILVGCNAWLVAAQNDPIFEDDHQVHQLRKTPYEDLLKEVKQSLGE